MKILNLFAGIGGNRLLWDDVLPGVKVTSVEFDPEIAKAYSKRFPNDDLIVGDAWDYAAKITQILILYGLAPHAKLIVG